MNIGAHVRGGGKLIPSLQAGVDIGATSIQVFTQSPRAWKPSLYAPEVLAAYREAQRNHPTITDTFCHATYLINLASADLELYEKSVATLTHNLSVARGMGASGLVLHVGSHLGAGFDDVVRQVADGLSKALAEADPAPPDVADCPILIENAAGAGGTVGRSFEEIQYLIDACNGDDRLGLCIDTQHLWASGFDYSSKEGTERLIRRVDETVGLKRLRCFHLNDSKIELGGNRDRHANIGEGTIGVKGLAPLLGHPLIRDLPLILEVPGIGDGPRAIDVVEARYTVEVGIEMYDNIPPTTQWPEDPSASHAPTPEPAAVEEVEVVAVVEPASAPAKKTVKKAAKKTAKKATKTAKKTVKKTVKKAAKATKSSPKKTVKKAAKKAVKKTAKKAAKATKSSAKKTVKKAAKKTAKKATKTAKKTVKKAVKKTAKKATKAAKKAGRSTKKR